MSVIYDFRQGWEDGRRERDAERAAGYDNSLFWTDGVVARPREEKPPFDNLFGGDKGGGSSWPEERRALVELCEQQQAEIAERDARLADFEAALAERDGLAADVEQWRAALDQRNAELEQWRAALSEANADIRALAERLARSEATRDRYQAKGKKLLAEVGEWRNHAEAIRKIPGGWKIVSKAVHPDTGPPGDRAVRTEIFKLVKLLFEGR